MGGVMSREPITAAADTLKPGDVIDFHPRGYATILRGPEEVPASEEFFGRSGHFKFWARRESDGNEGWITFGLGGHVSLVRKGD